MILIQGTLFNIFKTKGGVKDDGTAFEGKHKIQMLVDIAGEDGTTRKDIVDLSIEDTAHYMPLMGQLIQIEIGVFSSKSQTIFFVKKGALPVALTSPVKCK